MTPATPLVQPPVEDLRNALQICFGWEEWVEKAPVLTVPEASQALRDSLESLGDIRRLILHALDQFGEPNLPAIQAAATMLRETGSDDSHVNFQRTARDVAAAIIHAQLTGTVPPTWSANG